MTNRFTPGNVYKHASSLCFDAAVTILARSSSASVRLRKLAEQVNADGADVIAIRCCRCKLEWDDVVLQDYREIVCSNCYSERVVITTVRLMFHNWGEQNGGMAAQKIRVEGAVRYLQARDRRRKGKK
jgi:hypothetical protein